MKCEELEIRIHDLLDRGASPADDAVIVEHAADCDTCRLLVDAYSAMLAGVDALPAPVFVSERNDRSFAERAAETAMSNPVAPSDTAFDDAFSGFASDRHARSGSLVPMLVIAASLMVAAGVWWSSGQIDNPADSALATTANGGALDFELFDGRLPPEQIHAVCLSTGQSIVTLPIALGRVDTTRFTGSIRPVVEPVGAAWEAVRRTLPSGHTVAPDASSDTGWILSNERLQLA